MKVPIEGVSIELTDAQVEKIRKAKAARRRGYRTFEKMLISFGFKKYDSVTVYGVPFSYYEHSEHGWYGDIVDYGTWEGLWLVGHGLKDGGFPGGWTYGSPEEAAEELNKALEGMK